MKLNVVHAKILEDATSGGLQTKLDDFLAATGTFAGESEEREFISVDLRVPSSTLWTALVLYTE